MKWPWLSNYVASSFCLDRRQPGYWEYELFGLMILARGIQGLCRDRKIVGDPVMERVCRAVLYRIRRVADFRLLTESDLASPLCQIRSAQLRIEGLLGKAA
jgi:hypothetical protein